MPTRGLCCKLLVAGESNSRCACVAVGVSPGQTSAAMAKTEVLCTHIIVSALLAQLQFSSNSNSVFAVSQLAAWHELFRPSSARQQSQQRNSKWQNGSRGGVTSGDWRGKQTAFLQICHLGAFGVGGDPVDVTLWETNHPNTVRAEQDSQRTTTKNTHCSQDANTKEHVPTRLQCRGVSRVIVGHPSPSITFPLTSPCLRQLQQLQATVAMPSGAPK